MEILMLIPLFAFIKLVIFFWILLLSQPKDGTKSFSRCSHLEMYHGIKSNHLVTLPRRILCMLVWWLWKWRQQKFWLHKKNSQRKQRMESDYSESWSSFSVECSMDHPIRCLLVLGMFHNQNKPKLGSASYLHFLASRRLYATHMLDTKLHVWMRPSNLKHWSEMTRMVSIKILISFGHFWKTKSKVRLPSKLHSTFTKNNVRRKWNSLLLSLPLATNSRMTATSKSTKHPLPTLSSSKKILVGRKEWHQKYWIYQ